MVLLLLLILLLLLQVKVLSGGEKARLALAKFMCTQGTLLILDEPTNHLDIPSKETLEEAVRWFEGAVIAVSHDRYFLKRIATRVLLVRREGGLVGWSWLPGLVQQCSL